MKYPTIALLVLAVSATAASAADIAPVKTEAPAGTYKLDPTHASLTFKVEHLGLSFYTARFTRLDATLELDPANPAAAKLSATVDPKSLETDFPLAQPDFDAELQGPQFLDAGQFPTMTYRSTGVTMTGANTAKIDGELTLHGVTQPVALDATFNGGYAAIPMGPQQARIGFSAHGWLKRTNFGIGYGVPAPGSKIGVGDDVEVILEVEFTGPPAPTAK